MPAETLSSWRIDLQWMLHLSISPLGKMTGPRLPVYSAGGWGGGPGCQNIYDVYDDVTKQSEADAPGWNTFQPLIIRSYRLGNIIYYLYKFDNGVGFLPTNES